MLIPTDRFMFSGICPTWGEKNIIYFLFFFRFAEGLDLKIEMEHR